MTGVPAPCVYCRTMAKHNCQLQAVCTRVKAYHRARLYGELIDYNVRKGAKIAKKVRK